ncbi:PREDICTED: coiled-coil domain-containing protein 47-like [Priapulus caudatus]|uniref:PAT complex subunit CCDC47 n=1 Tax=Priapulus caudatus TaxID=37621 RepID=A0ABM1EXV0_PRICU|nr:PREDICTED: coiled-coil domain-containing protein 47-like [Priapulus caudatus]
MRGILVWLLLLVAIAAVQSANHHGAEIEDNEFAEFEEFDDEDDEFLDKPKESRETTKRESVEKSETDDDDEEYEEEEEEEEEEEDDHEGVVEDEEDDEFEHFTDEEEFEGFDKDVKSSPGRAKSQDTPDLKITNIPLHLRTNWDSFYVEILMLVGLAVYFLNFLAGKSKNQRLANAWFTAHRELLEANFKLVGDDGVATEPVQGEMLKESENTYMLWCSGRTCCEGMLVELKFLKRQDLISVISRLLRPVCDQIMVKVTMDADNMDTFVFAVAQKRTATRIHKDQADLSQFCTEKKAGEKLGLPSQFVLLSEIGEATTAMLDGKMMAILRNFTEMVDYIHFSDQYTGPKLQDEQQQSELPKRTKMLLFVFNVPGQGNATVDTMMTMKPLLQLVFHCMEKVKRFKLSKEAKTKAERNRQKMEEQYLKQLHSQRQEQAQQRREDKRRAEKEKILAEDDPDKQRKMEERDHRRDVKKRQPKVKQMKVRAM